MTATAPKRKDSPLGRFYEIDGRQLPSVTHILQAINKPALVNWAANQERALCVEAAADLYGDLAKTPPLSRPVYVSTLQDRIGKQKAHQRQVAKASEIGSQTHALIEWELRRSMGQVVGPEPKVVDGAQWAYMAWQDWAASVSLKPIHVEQAVFSLTHGYAGTLDLVAEMNGARTVIDFKTGKSIYAEAHLQTAAYRYALEEMGHGRVDNAVIVRLPKIETDPEFEVAACKPINELFPTFLAVKQVWDWWYAGEVAYRERLTVKR